MKLKQLYNTFAAEARKLFTFSKPNFEETKESHNHAKPANFETAIRATGFGKYNMLLLLIAFPSGMAHAFATTAISFVIPIAECDLNLTLENKGMLNAITYLGMITSGFFWGYLSDTIGRRKLLVIGYLCNGFCVLLSGFSQHYVMLVILQFLQGFIINGPFAALVSYLNEFHCAKYRSFIPTLNGITLNTSCIVLPLLGWFIFTRPVEIYIYTNVVVLRSWNLFFLVCSIPSLMAGFLFMLLPESPKFQMTIGDNAQAYKTFQKIYSWNSGCSPDAYPVKSLSSETNFVAQSDVPKSKVQIIKEGRKQLLPLFHVQYGSKMVLVASIQLLIMMGLNALRLWLPQLFAAISSYQTLHPNAPNDETSLCTILEQLHPNKTTTNETCIVNYNISSAYANSIVVSLTGIVCFLSAAVLTKFVGKKLTMAFSAFLGGIGGTCMYFAQDEISVTALSATFIGLTTVSTNTLLGIVVDIFPTTLRTMAVALTMISGRSGAMAGNLIFPSLLAAGCFPPFVTVGCLVIGGAIMSLGLPKTDTKELE